MRPPIRRIASLALLLAAGPVLAGCYSSHLARRETISPHGGDAMAANRVMMMVDPWPDYAWNKRLPHDGKRMAKAAGRYRDPPDPNATGGTPAMSPGITDSNNQQELTGP
jgi:hypothetical protein